VTVTRGGGLLAVTVVGLAVSVMGMGGASKPARAAPAFQPTTKVVVFPPTSSDPLVARLEAELEAVGIIVSRVNLPPDAQLDAVITREIALGASAVIRVIPRSRGTEVWTGDTTARVLRRRSIHADTSDAALSLIAMRTVEFLRASLLEVRIRGANIPGVAKSPGGVNASNNPGGPAAGRETAAREKPTSTEKTTPIETRGPPATPPETSTEGPVETTVARRGDAPAAAPPSSVAPASRPTPAPTPAPAPTSGDTSEAPLPAPRPAPAPTATSNVEARATVPLEPHRASGQFEITVGPAFLASPGGIAPIISAATIGRGRITERSGMEIMAVFPVVSRRLTTPEGSTQVSTALFGLAADFRLVPRGPWMADAAIGVSALMFRSVGSPGGVTHVGKTDSAWKLATHVRLGTGRQIGRWLAIRVDGIAGLTPASRIVLTYSDVDRATWGPVFAAGALSVQAAW
jgi:hypothetical protein